MTAQGCLPPGHCGGHSDSPSTLPTQQNYLGCTNEIEICVHGKLLMLEPARLDPNALYQQVVLTIAVKRIWVWKTWALKGTLAVPLPTLLIIRLGRKSTSKGSNCAQGPTLDVGRDGTGSHVPGFPAQRSIISEPPSRVSRRTLASNWAGGSMVSSQIRRRNAH